MLSQPLINLRRVFSFVGTMVRFSPRGFIGECTLALFNALFSGVGLMMFIPLLHLTGHLAPGEKAATKVLGFLPEISGHLSLISCFGIFLGLIVLSGAVEYAHRWYTAVNRLRFVQAIEQKLNAGMAHVQWSYLLENRAQNATHLITTGPLQLSTLMLTCQQGISGLLSIFVYSGLSLFLSWRLTFLAVILALGPILLGCRTKAFALSRSLFLKDRFNQRQLFKFVEGIKLAKSYNLVGNYLRQFEKLSDEALFCQMQAFRNQGVFQLVFKISSAVIIVAVFYVAFETLRLPLSTVITLLLLFSQLMPRLATLQENYLKAVDAVSVFENMNARIEQYRRHAAELIPSARLTLQNEIRFANVSYFHGTKPTLHEISCVLRAREMTAIVGKSGAGKTTFADLFLGLLSPQRGTISIDGVTLDAGNIEGWRASVSYVPQEPYFFHDTIRANFAWVNPDVTDEQIWEALELTGAKHLVGRLTHGLDTPLGDKGMHFSGGERQCLMLARALVRYPDVLLLDEPTSSLDSLHEESIRRALEALRGRMTIVVIAHRLSTLRTADRVLVLENGHLVETGRPLELLRTAHSVFGSLFSAQAGIGIQAG